MILLFFFFLPLGVGLVFESFFRVNVYQPKSIQKSMQLAIKFNGFIKIKKNDAM